MAATEIVLEAPAALEDDLVAALWRYGSTGSWAEPADHGARIRLHAFFDSSTAPTADALVATIGRPEVRATGAAAPAEERDWIGEWNASAGPIEVGERFVVDPREPESAPEPFALPGRRTLRLPARTAFGIGSHESTRLAVELLEKTDPTGKRVLDVGAGSGILSFAALALGAREVVALDLDPVAALLLPQMQRLNGMRFPAFAGTVAALAPTARFDLALVNVIPSEIEEDLATLTSLLEPGARAIFSGLLEEQRADALTRLANLGFQPLNESSCSSWIALTMELPR